MKTLLEGIYRSYHSNKNGQAIVDIDGTIITYEQLINTSQKWARVILYHNSAKVKRIGIFCERSITGYIGIISSLMTNSAYVPLNFKFPIEKNSSIISEADLDTIIVDKKCLNKLIEISKKIKLPKFIYTTDIAADDKELTFQLINLNSETFDQKITLPLPKEGDIVYILFTSGSTGKPKGVPIRNKSVCSFINYNSKLYMISKDDRFSQTFDLTFDLSVFDIFMSLCNEASFYIMRPIDLLAPSQYINDKEITVWFSVPSIIRIQNSKHISHKLSLPHLRLSLFCGEPILEDEMATWAEYAPNSICENLYGPTELTIACSRYRWTRDDKANEATEYSNKNISYNDILSIGKIYPHLEYILLDDKHRREDNLDIEVLNTNNKEGILYVSGDQCYEGYLNVVREDTFIVVQTADGRCRRYYNTGDYVRQDNEGNLLYVTRVDDQIKIDGNRIELGEVESTINKMDGVDKSIAVGIKKQGLFNDMAAYIVGSVGIEDVRSYLKQRLPNYMIPRYIKVAKKFPLNDNGKIDKKAIIEVFMTEETVKLSLCRSPESII